MFVEKRKEPVAAQKRQRQNPSTASENVPHNFKAHDLSHTGIVFLPTCRYACDTGCQLGTRYHSVFCYLHVLLPLPPICLAEYAAMLHPAPCLVQGYSMSRCGWPLFASPIGCNSKGVRFGALRSFSFCPPDGGRGLRSAQQPRVRAAGVLVRRRASLPALGGVSRQRCTHGADGRALPCQVRASDRSIFVDLSFLLFCLFLMFRLLLFRLCFCFVVVPLCFVMCLAFSHSFFYGSILFSSYASSGGERSTLGVLFRFRICCFVLFCFVLFLVFVVCFWFVSLFPKPKCCFLPCSLLFPSIANGIC